MNEHHKPPKRHRDPHGRFTKADVVRWPPESKAAASVATYNINIVFGVPVMFGPAFSKQTGIYNALVAAWPNLELPL